MGPKGPMLVPGQRGYGATGLPKPFPKASWVMSVVAKFLGGNMETYPLVICCSSLLKMAHRNFVDFPINSMVIFHSYVNVYQRVWKDDAKLSMRWFDSQ